jgi:hypothetical protein
MEVRRFMRRFIGITAALGTIGLAVPLEALPWSSAPTDGAIALQAPRRRPPTNPACITYKKEVRHRDGYEHLVHVTNSCSADAECNVSSDAQPRPVGVTVKSGTTQTVVLTRRAHTAYFQATVNCSIRT